MPYHLLVFLFFCSSTCFGVSSPIISVPIDFKEISLLESAKLTNVKGVPLTVSEGLDLEKVLSDTCKLHFDLVNTSGQIKVVRFDVGSIQLEYFKFYTVDEDISQLMFSIDRDALAIDQSLAILPGDTVKCVVTAANNYKGANFNPSIQDNLIWQRSQYRTVMVSTLFYGAMFFVVVFSLILVFYFKRKFIIWYALYVLCFGLFLMNYEGLFDQIIYLNYRDISRKFSISLVFLSYLFNILFLTDFLNIKERMPALNSISKFYIIVLFIFATANFITPVNDYFREYVMIYAMLCMLLVGIVVVTSFIRKVEEARLVLFSYCWLIFFGFLTTQIEFSEVSNLISGNVLMKIGLFGEVVILTTAVLLLLFRENDGLRQMLKLELDKSQDMNAQLIEKQDELTHLSKIKDRFLVNISHELRTPLNAILGTITILKSQGIPQGSLSYLDMIKKAGLDLMHVIDDILSIKILSKDELVIDDDEFDLGGKLEDLASLYRDKAFDKKLYFEYSNGLFKDRRSYHGDSVKLIKAISVILDNALKYTFEGSINLSAVLVDLNDEFDELEIKVSDSGMGISLGNQADVFEMFTQENNDYSRGYGGAGVGLTIFQKIVEKLGGEILFSSEENKGSVFGFKLKLRKVIHKPLIKEVNESRKLRVLIVEDDDVNQFIAIQLLGKVSLPIDCLVAENGIEAVSVLRENDVDLIFMDIQMPLMDGYEATQKIRVLENKSKAHVPIVALTAHTQNSERLKSREVGMNDFVTKPYTVKDLDNILKQYCRQ